MSKLLAALLVASVSFAAELPTAESLLEKCLNKSGGAAAYAGINGVAMSGSVEMVGHNISGPASVFQQGDKTYSVIELPGVGKVEEGFDGQIAWEVNALTGPRIKDGDEKTATVRASKMGLNLMTTWKEYYKEAHTLGAEDVGGKPAWKVQLTPKEGKAEVFYFDKDSGLLVRVTQTVTTPLGEIPVESGFSDYRAVKGVLTPFSLTQTAMSQVMVMRFDKVEWNPALPADRFELPAAIRTLAARKN